MKFDMDRFTEYLMYTGIILTCSVLLLIFMVGMMCLTGHLGVK